jgi:transcriptional repressor NrdR
MADDGSAIRRRRECLACGRRFTTFERMEEMPLVVLKRSGAREPFDREKVATGIARAAKNRPMVPEAIEEMAAQIEDHLRTIGVEVTTEQVGVAVLDRLRVADPVAYLRFASVYKGFEGVDDFEREVVELQKTTAPKDPPRR